MDQLDRLTQWFYRSDSHDLQCFDDETGRHCNTEGGKRVSYAFGYNLNATASLTRCECVADAAVAALAVKQLAGAGVPTFHPS